VHIAAELTYVTVMLLAV